MESGLNTAPGDLPSTCQLPCRREEAGLTAGLAGEGGTSPSGQRRGGKGPFGMGSCIPPPFLASTSGAALVWSCVCRQSFPGVGVDVLAAVPVAS